MLSVEQTARTLRALAKTLVDNERDMTEQMRESLVEAGFRAVMEPPQVSADNAAFFNRPGVKQGLAKLDKMERSVNASRN